MDNYNFRAKSVLIANLIDFKRKSKNWILGKTKEMSFCVTANTMIISG